MKTNAKRVAISPKFRLWAARIIVLMILSGVISLTGFKIHAHRRLQAPLDRILEEAGADQLDIAARYERLFKRDTIVFDVRELGEPGTGVLLRSFYEFATTQKGTAYDEVKIAYRGRIVLKIDGGTFQQLGLDFGKIDIAKCNQRFALAVQLPGGRRVMDMDHRILGRVMKAAAKRMRER